MSRSLHPLEGRCALVTGASRGIGLAIATALVEAGAKVTLMARREDRLRDAAEALSDSGEVDVVVGDILEEADVERAVGACIDRWGSMDVLVNNAGVIRFASLVETSVEDWDAILQTNARGTFLMTREALRRMTEGGVVLNVASTFGTTPVKGYAAYCASKAAILHLTRVAALEGARSGIRVNALAPGYIATDINVEALADDDIRAAIERQVPMRRVADPEELGPVAVHLCSDESAYTTGAVITVDGGYGLR